MDFKEMRDIVADLQKNDYKNFIKALVSIEKGISDEQGLDEVYERYTENDAMGLLDEEFDYIIDELEEDGKLNRQESQKEEKEVVNLIGNIVKEPEITQIMVQNKEIDVANFVVGFNWEDGKKQFEHVAAYDDKLPEVVNFKKGDFVKIFGEVKHYTSKSGKEYKQIDVLKAQLLKAREHKHQQTVTDTAKETIEQSKQAKDKATRQPKDSKTPPKEAAVKISKTKKKESTLDKLTKLKEKVQEKAHKPEAKDKKTTREMD